MESGQHRPLFAAPQQTGFESCLAAKKPLTRTHGLRRHSLFTRQTVTLIIVSLSVLLLFAAITYKTAHDYIYAENFQRLHKNNQQLINFLQPLSATLENIQQLIDSRTDYSEAYAIIDRQDKLIPPSASSRIQDPLPDIQDEILRQNLLTAFLANDKQSAFFTHGHFEYNDSVQLWAADNIPGTAYTLIHSTHHKHTSLGEWLKNINIPLTLIILCASLFTIWAPVLLKKIGPEKPLVLQDKLPGEPINQKENLAHDLDNAIRNNKLELYFQPKLDLGHGQISGVEALARWLHPEHGFIPPEIFIQLAERNGLIQALTQWVLETAIAQCTQWQQMGKSLNVSINLSAHNLYDNTLTEQIERLLHQQQVLPAHLTLEISEADILSSPEKTRSLFEKLKKIGVRIAIDDMGSNTVTLECLHRFPVDEIKIDRSVIQHIANDEISLANVKAGVDLACELGLAVVAEGVENQQTLELLQQMGCDFAQGYYVCRPMPNQDLLPVVSACQAGSNIILHTAEKAWIKHSA